VAGKVLSWDNGEAEIDVLRAVHRGAQTSEIRTSVIAAYIAIPYAVELVGLVVAPPSRVAFQYASLIQHLYIMRVLICA